MPTSARKSTTGVFVVLAVVCAIAPAQAGIVRPLDPIRPATTVRVRVADPGGAGLAYALGLSHAATPAIPIGDGRVVPLANDPLLAYSVTPGAPGLAGFSGVLDAHGEATAFITIPQDPALVGLDVALAAVTIDPAGGIARVAQPCRLKLLATTPAPDWSQVTARMQQAIASGALPGAALAIVSEGTTLYRQAFGTFTTSTQVPVASATKWLSAMVLMTLVDDGLCTLDTPLLAAYPALTAPKGAITLRQLFSHSSGMVSQASCLGDGTTTLQACAAQILLPPLAAPPGTVFSYGGASMHVAGAAAEVLLAAAGTGQSFHDRFFTRLKTPLGAATLAFNSTTNPRVAGGMSASITDVEPVLVMLLGLGELQGATILSSASVARMLADETSSLPVANSPGGALGASSYGIGVWRTGLDANGGAFEGASMGAFGSVFWVDFTRGYGAFLLTADSGTADASQVFMDLRSLIVAALP